MVSSNMSLSTILERFLMTRHNDTPLTCVFTLLLSSLCKADFKDQWVCSLGAVCRQTTQISSEMKSSFAENFFKFSSLFRTNWKITKFSTIRHIFSDQNLPFEFGTLILFRKLIIYVYVQYSNIAKESLRDDAENHKSKEWKVHKFIYRK